MILSALVSMLGGCASLPSSGPDVREVVRAGEGPRPVLRIVDITEANQQDIGLNTTPDPGSFDSIARAAISAPVDQIAVGDTLQITVFEVGATLFGGSGGQSAAGALASTANAQTLPPAPVRPDGYVIVPYVGRIVAAGRTPAELAGAIEAGLHGKSQSPQVVVSVREDLGNTVMMIGDVKSPGRKPLSYRRERLLDLIAISGGPTNPKSDTVVRINRNGRAFEMNLGDIQSGAVDDITLQPQDRVELAFHPRTFTAFGATGKVSEIPFQSATHLSLAEALARMGGPLDQQADPTGIFIFRAKQIPGEKPVIYRINLKKPEGYFVAQNFQIHDKDLIFVANARSMIWYKFLGIINSVISPVVTAKYLGG